MKFGCKTAIYVSAVLYLNSDAFDANFGVGILRVTKGLDISLHITEDELIQACE